MLIYIASDHAGFDVKNKLYASLEELGHDVVDLGTDSEESCHYPDFATSLCEMLQSNPSARGVLICGSGIGVSMVANRFSSIRAALCHSSEVATLSREHNNSNVICLGARVISLDSNKEILAAWLNAKFKGERHSMRLNKFNSFGLRKIFRYFESNLELFLMTSGLMMVLLGTIIARINHEYFKSVLTVEDGFMEWSSVIFLLSASIVSFNRANNIQFSRLGKIVSLLFGFLFLFGAGEEISWGQRLLNIESGDFFKEINSQGETNLHNLTINGVKINKLIFGKLLGLILILYFLVMPWLLNRARWLKEIVRKTYLPMPKNIHILFFVLVAVLAELSGSPKKGELTEFAGTLIFFMIFMYPKNEKDLI